MELSRLQELIELLKSMNEPIIPDSEYQYLRRKDWTTLSEQIESESFYLRYFNKINWTVVARNHPNIEFLMKNLKADKFFHIYKNPHITEEHALQIIQQDPQNEHYWYDFIHNQNISDKFIIQHYFNFNNIIPREFNHIDYKKYFMDILHYSHNNLPMFFIKKYKLKASSYHIRKTQRQKFLDEKSAIFKILKFDF